MQERSDAPYQDSVRFKGQPEYIYVVTRRFRDAPEKSITLNILPAELPPHTGAFAWGTVVEIVLQFAKPKLNQLTRLAFPAEMAVLS